MTQALLLVNVAMAYWLLWHLSSHCDFAAPYTAGVMARNGQATEAYDPVTFQAHLVVPLSGTMAWLYPPFAFLFWAPLSLIPYEAAYHLFILGSVIAYTWAAYRIIPGWATVLASVWFSGLVINLGYGQNAALMTAILAFGLLRMEKEEFSGGVILGLLCLKPHFLPMIFVALICSRRGWALIGMATTGAALVLTSILFFGLAPWHAFLDHVATGSVLQDQMAPVDAASSMYAGGYGFWLICLLIANIATGWAWHTGRSFRSRVSILIVSLCVAAPYLHFYDLALLGLPVALYARRQSEANDKLAIFVITSTGLWVLRFIGAVWGLALAPFVLLAVLLLICLEE